MGRAKKKPEPKSLEQLKEELLQQAEEKGISEHYFFKTTFERYEMQLTILARLKTAIDQDDILVEKTYVKDRTNIGINPAITEYNKTASAANGTVATLVKILSNLGATEDSQPGSAIREFCGL